MIAGDRVAIAHTRVDYWPDTTASRPVDAQASAQLSIWINAAPLDAHRARALGSALPRSRSYDAIASLRASTDAAPADVERVQRYCSEHGLDVIGAHWRSIDVRGPLGQCMDAFGAEVSLVADGEGHTFRSRRGPLTAAAAIAPLIRGVFGFSQWPRAHRLGALQRHATPLSIGDLTRRYALPDATGRGTTIGIIQLGGEFRAADFQQCMNAHGISREMPIVKRIDDAPGTHALATTQDLESALDAQIAAAIAPGARIVIYRGSDSERALIDAVRTALFDEEETPSILSISYGWPERLWTPAAVDVLNDLFTAAALLGVTVVCASGDNGAELDAERHPHVLFPASSPYVLACGATSLGGDDSTTESAWERTGGGYSEEFPLPQWQSSPQGNGRGVPDVAAQQSPGYRVYLEGVELAAGGTSAVAPMWSALIARVNERVGTRSGFFTPLLYATPHACSDVVTGSNGFFSAGPGWNACTGLGVPSGASLEAMLRG